MNRDRTSKYLKISQEIISQIESGILQPGNKISSENELINEYKISNTTARKVLSYVENQGWVKKIKGQKGSFVTYANQKSTFANPDFDFIKRNTNLDK